MQIKVSVIVPIYNVERYLRKCIDSIINQSYRNLEIILVDDGSPDNCGKICDEYSTRDMRVKVIHKTNGGLSDARNAGMRIASGDYFAFVDSDDWIEPQMFERLVNNSIIFEADISVGGVVDLLEEDNRYIPFKSTFDGKLTNYVLEKEDAMKKYFLGSWSAWDKIYKKSVFDGIWYPKGEINEDEAIVLQLLDRCKNVCYTNEVFYNYVTRPKSSSITATAFSPKKIAWYEHCKANLEFVKQKYPALTEYAEKRYFSSLIWCLNNMTADVNKFKNNIEPLRKELKSTFKKFISNQHIEKKEKFRGFCLAYGYDLYAAIVKILGKHYT